MSAPIRRIDSRCWACAASGHAMAEPPRRVMKSRRVVIRFSSRLNLTKHRYLVSLHQLPVDLEPQTGLLRRVYQPLLVHLDVLHQTVLVGTAGGKHLVVVAVVDGHGDVQIGGVAQGVSTVMNLALHAEAI